MNKFKDLKSSKETMECFLSPNAMLHRTHEKEGREKFFENLKNLTEKYDVNINFISVYNIHQAPEYAEELFNRFKEAGLEKTLSYFLSQKSLTAADGARKPGFAFEMKNSSEIKNKRYEIYESEVEKGSGDFDSEVLADLVLESKGLVKALEMNTNTKLEALKQYHDNIGNVKNTALCLYEESSSATEPGKDMIEAHARETIYKNTPAIWITNNYNNKYENSFSVVNGEKKNMKGSVKPPKTYPYDFLTRGFDDLHNNNFELEIKKLTMKDVFDAYNKMDPKKGNHIPKEFEILNDLYCNDEVENFYKTVKRFCSQNQDLDRAFNSQMQPFVRNEVIRVHGIMNKPKQVSSSPEDDRK